MTLRRVVILCPSLPHLLSAPRLKGAHVAAVALNRAFLAVTKVFFACDDPGRDHLDSPGATPTRTSRTNRRILRRRTGFEVFRGPASGTIYLLLHGAIPDRWLRHSAREAFHGLR